jgi:peroxiredoxin
LARHDITFPLLWDEGFETWQAFGVSSQPAAALLSPSGENLAGWFGMYDADEVLRLAAEA